jgi:hypothetical protein
LAGIVVATGAWAETAPSHLKEHPSLSPPVLSSGRSAPVFIENRGQFDSRVRFQVRAAGKVLWLTDKGIVFDLLKSRALPAAEAPSAAGGPAFRGVRQPADEPVDRLVFAENFIDSNEHPAIEAKSARAGAYNYLIGSDSANWHTDVHGYGELLYRDVWPGIDVRISANGSDLEQEFVVHPGGDHRQIKVSYDGIEKLKVASDGSLAVQTAFGVLRESKPRIYQQFPGKTTAVKGRFVLSGDSTYTFAVDSYRPEYALVIDPTVLLYSTYLGGSSNDQGWAIAVDSAGNAYVTGYTNSLNFPTTAGAYLTTLPSPPAGFVTKVSATGIPVYSTFWDQFARGIAVDAAGEAYITGGSDVWVAKLNAAGSALLYEVNLGSGTPQAIAVDASGDAYIAGTSGGGLTTTPNAYQQSPAGGVYGYSYGEDAFVAVLDPQGTLRYSTYIGGIEDDQATSIAVDAYGGVYVGGFTYGPYFPTTPGAFQTVFKSNNPECTGHENCTSGWVAKLNPNIVGAAGLIYSSYLGSAGNQYGGTSSSDWVYGIAVDSSGCAYAAGVAGWYGFPVTPGAFNTSTFGGSFVTKFNPGGSGLIYSTIVGPTGLESLSGIALDALGEAYVVGGTGGASSSVVPVTPDAFQSVAPTANAFLVKLNAAGSGVLYGSYLGGSVGDVAHSVAVDPTGDAYLAGAACGDFPVTPFAFQPTCGGSSNAFVTKFPLGAPGALSVTGIVPTTGGNAGTVSPEIVGTGFHAGATAQLNCGGPAIPGTNLTVGPNGQLLNMTFNLATASPGTCDVKVTNPDGTSATLPRAFAVQQGGAPNIQISLTGVVEHEGNDSAPAPNNATLLVTVSNIGGVDSPGEIVSLPVNPPFTGTLVSPPDLAPQPSNFDVWSSAPIASGSAQTFTATETAVGPACGGSAALNVQACVTPVVGTNWGKWGQCMANTAILAGTCLTVGACLGLDGLSGGLLTAAIAACTGAALTCIGSAYNAFYESSLSNCFKNAQINGPPICFTDQLPCVSASDPNNLVGPPGVGGQRWTAGTQALTYGISFNNDPTATAPAQQVVVTQPLGANVNLSSLGLLALTIPNGTTGANVQVPVPAGSFNPAAGVNEFTTTADLRPTQSLLVNVDAKLNTAAQTLTWTLGSIDPATGSAPLNPLVGFLPPGTGATVAFSVTPQAGLATGTQVSDQAAVVFDANAPLSTPVWTNMIDNTPPVSAVAALAAAQTTSCFRPQWTATDVGSGVQGTTIFVSDTGGAYAPWLTNTTAASAIYNGVAGHTYAFYSQATDLVGNVEATKSSPDASTSVPVGASCNGRPTIAGSVASNSVSGTTETLTLQLTDNGVGNAQNINITSVSLRTLVGTGSVTLSSPGTPLSVGSLAAGASVTETLTLNAPATVKEYSITEAGTVQDLAGNTYSFSIAQAVIP